VSGHSVDATHETGRQLKSSESGGNSNSPHGGNSSSAGRALAKAPLGRMENPTEIRRRRNRLSTISSDFIDENAESPRLSGFQRRKSSNFDMLCDPFKYQEYVQNFLDGIEEEEEQKVHSGVQRQAYRKRTRSNHFLSQPNTTPLHEIDEEPYPEN
jgi:hypothetical protein